MAVRISGGKVELSARQHKTLVGIKQQIGEIKADCGDLLGMGGKCDKVTAALDELLGSVTAAVSKPRPPKPAGEGSATQGTPANERATAPGAPAPSSPAAASQPATAAK